MRIKFFGGEDEKQATGVDGVEFPVGNRRRLGRRDVELSISVLKIDPDEK